MYENKQKEKDIIQMRLTSTGKGTFSVNQLLRWLIFKQLTIKLFDLCTGGSSLLTSCVKISMTEYKDFGKYHEFGDIEKILLRCSNFWLNFKDIFLSAIPIKFVRSFLFAYQALVNYCFIPKSQNVNDDNVICIDYA